MSLYYFTEDPPKAPAPTPAWVIAYVLTAGVVSFCIVQSYSEPEPVRAQPRPTPANTPPPREIATQPEKDTGQAVGKEEANRPLLVFRNPVVLDPAPRADTDSIPSRPSQMDAPVRPRASHPTYTSYGSPTPEPTPRLEWEPSRKKTSPTRSPTLRPRIERPMEKPSIPPVPSQRQWASKSLYPESDFSMVVSPCVLEIMLPIRGYIGAAGESKKTYPPGLHRIEVKRHMDLRIAFRSTTVQTIRYRVVATSHGGYSE